MNYVFEVVDKSGRNIRLTRKQWQHLMKRHPYMQKYIEEIKQTLQFPDKIINLVPDKSYYYKNYKNLYPPNRFIFIVVKYLNGAGFVITAYLKEKIK